MARTGVIVTASGLLLRWGVDIDWSAAPGFDPATESYRTDIPDPAYIRDQRGTPGVSRWTGSAWVVLPHPFRYIWQYNGPAMLTAAQGVTAKVTRLRVVNGEVFLFTNALLTATERTSVQTAIAGVPRIVILAPLES